MARIACVLANGFEDSEFKDPYEAFRHAGHQIDIIGLKAHEDLRGERGQVHVRSDVSFDDVRAADYDALFIPGGHSPDRLRADERAVKLVADMDRASKPIFAVCHGPQLLMTARRIEGRTLTAWKTVQDDLRLDDDVTVLDEPVVHDRNWVTSRSPADLPLFVEASLRYLQNGTAHDVYA